MTRKPRSEEFQRFDKVMDGLLAVPYKELQQKLEEEKATKAKRKKGEIKPHKKNPAQHQ